MSIRLLIADDQELVRTGLRLIVESEQDLQVVGEAADGEDAIRKARAFRPDIALMDIRMPGTDGIEAARQIVQSVGATRVIVLTTFSADEYVFQALAAGASGFLLKDGPADELIRAIRIVAAGDSLLSPSVTTGVIRQFAQRSPIRDQPGRDDLTERELEVWKLLARGLSNAEIADQLIVGEATVKTHVARVLNKLGLRDRTQAVIAAYESGLVRPGDSPG
ncbi:MAG TPA: response regulator transcription factor [Thermoleophilaceae bacterium]|nr:response regulator transcription factor [Thermoleophilaceae bacterium]